MWLLASILVLTSPATTPTPKAPEPTQKAPVMTPAPTTTPAPTAPEAVDPCVQLSADEQEFAKDLSTGNKTIFCAQFTPAQRARSMDLSGQMGLDGNLITNDEAVERVARENNIPLPPPGNGMRRGSACPMPPKS